MFLLTLYVLDKIATLLNIDKRKLVTEKIETMTDITQIQESEYDAILRQAVAVIDRTRAMVATAVSSAIGTSHWEIGKLLHDRTLLPVIA